MENKEQAAEHYAHNNFNMHDLNHYKALEQGFIAGVSWQSSQPINSGWVSVETPPKENSDVWVVEDGKVIIAYYWDYCGSLTYMYDDQEIAPTHWMYLITPSRPKQ